MSERKKRQSSRAATFFPSSKEPGEGVAVSEAAEGEESSKKRQKRTTADEESSSSSKKKRGDSFWTDDPPPDSNELGVANIHLAIPEKNRFECRQEGCNRVAAESNYRFCPFHGGYFVPQGENVACNLKLGLEFMIYGTGKNKPCKQLCACGQDLCRSIGYPNHGVSTIPLNNKEQALEWANALNMSEDAKEKALSNNRAYRVAYWHFYPEHREFIQVKNKEGNTEKKWQLKPLVDKSLDDNQKKKFSLPPPVYPLESFIEDYRANSGESTSNTERRPRAENIALEAKAEALAWALQKKKVEEKQANEMAAVEARMAIKKVQASNKAQMEKLMEELEASHAKKLAKQESAKTILKGSISKLQNELKQRERQVRETSLHATVMLNVQAYDFQVLDHHKTMSEQEIAKLRHEVAILREEKERIQYTLDATKIRLSEALDKVTNEAIAKKDGIIAKNTLTPLRYKHFTFTKEEGGRMRNFCGVFFPFPDIESVEMFLDAINVKQNDCDILDAGVCSRLRRRSYTASKLKKNGGAKEIEDDGGDNGGGAPLDTRPKLPLTGTAGRPRALHWKDEFLVYCLYQHAKVPVAQIGAHMNVSKSAVLRIIHAWADYLEVISVKTVIIPCAEDLDETMPTKRAYPENLLAIFLARPERMNHDAHNNNEEEEQQPARLQDRVLLPADADVVDEKITPTIFTALCNHLRELKKSPKKSVQSNKTIARIVNHR